MGIKRISKSPFPNGYYHFNQKNQPKDLVYVEVEADSISIFQTDGTLRSTDLDFYLVKKSLDFDAMSLAFKYRPSAAEFPRQLNANFNGNIYLGYRLDRYWWGHKKTPTGSRKQLYRSAITMGAFGGIGATFLSPWTTNYNIADEYDGFILSRGFAVMTDLSSFTVGIGVGWDYLTDRDKHVWIYQNKPWVGLTIGLHVN